MRGEDDGGFCGSALQYTLDIARDGRAYRDLRYRRGVLPFRVLLAPVPEGLFGNSGLFVPIGRAESFPHWQMIAEPGR